MIRALALMALLTGATDMVGLPPSAALAQSLNPAVTPETVGATTCIPGWTRGARPSFWDSQKLKLKLLKEEGLTWLDAPKFQLDHIVPLCLGGHPTDPANLQLQEWEVAKLKDRLEAKLCCLVCTGQETIEAAQKAISADWQAAYWRYAKIKCRREK